MEPFRKLISKSKVLSWIAEKIAVHTAISDAHHVKYTDAEVDAILAVHTGITDAHHLPYTDAMVNAIVATHTAISGAHHMKYTDAEAVAAVDASDSFVERNVENTVTSMTTLKRTTSGNILGIKSELPFGMIITDILRGDIISTNTTYTNMLIVASFLNIYAGGSDITKRIGTIAFVKYPGTKSFCGFSVINAAGGIVESIRLESDKIDVLNKPIKDIKNHTHSALSGTKKLIELDINGVPYYFEVYPTKA